MSAAARPRVCYLLSPYISHRRAGTANRAALAAAGIPLVDRPRDADIVIVHEESPALPWFFRATPELHERYVISYSVWEATRLPERRASCLRLADEVWTCSAFCRDVLADATAPITVIPHIVAPPRAPDPAALRELDARLGAPPGAFLFYTIGTLLPRKNLQAAVDAFAALGAGDAARFVLKTDRPAPQGFRDVPGVIPLDGDLPEALIDALHHRAHCFVSAHCSEGWGLGLSEAMAHGNLAVATGFGGCLDFMDADTALLVDYDLGPVQPEARPGLGFMATDGSADWAYVRVADLSAKMARALNEWEALAGMRAAAAAATERFRSEAVGALMAARLAAVDPAARRPSPRRLIHRAA